jgi:hypothetical protein
MNESHFLAYHFAFGTLNYTLFSWHPPAQKTNMLRFEKGQLFSNPARPLCFALVFKINAAQSEE